jgi:hypothetical protein
MLLKKTLTAVAVDSARDYLRERLEALKQLDLDHDGTKDVDQIVELLGKVSEKLKVSIEATDFQKLAAGLEQVINGATLVGASIDREKLSDASREMVSGLSQVGKLLRLGIQEAKSERQS